MPDPHLALFEEQRRRLFGIAYRMLGSVTEAQDMMQECYLRWHQAAAETIRSPQAWLTTVITRLCLNHLQLVRVKRETYVGPWLPEPLVDEQATDPASSSMLADSLSLAFLVLLETLSPTERAVFILREGFECDFADIARMVEKSEENCRQILARARKRIDEGRPRYDVSRSDAEKVVASYLMALGQNDLDAMLARLAENVVLVADAGGKPGAMLKPLHGAGPVAHAMLHAARNRGVGPEEFRLATINGLPGLVRFHNGRALAVLACGLVGGRIAAVFIISNPGQAPAPPSASLNTPPSFTWKFHETNLHSCARRAWWQPPCSGGWCMPCWSPRMLHNRPPPRFTVRLPADSGPPRPPGWRWLVWPSVEMPLRRSNRRSGPGHGRNGARVALVAGLIAAVNGGLNVAVATGGPGTGNGVIGGAAALVMGLIAMALGGLVLTRAGPASHARRVLKT